MLRVGERLAFPVDRASFGSAAGPSTPVGKLPEDATGNSAGRARSDRGQPRLSQMVDDAGAAAKTTEAEKPVVSITDAADQDARTAAVVAELKATDTAVRAHEAAHVAVGGRYVRGAASYSYTTGPDGRQYAVGGEVSIDTAAERDPAATIAKMATVRAAALAPADPSAQDRAVAAAAAQAMAAAQVELREQQQAEQGGEAEDGAQTMSPAEEIEPASRESANAAPDRGFASFVAAAYVAANQPPAEPTFLTAA